MMMDDCLQVVTANDSQNTRFEVHRWCNGALKGRERKAQIRKGLKSPKDLLFNGNMGAIREEPARLRRMGTKPTKPQRFRRFNWVADAKVADQPVIYEGEWSRKWCQLEEVVL
jgi:hypothetical protein